MLILQEERMGFNPWVETSTLLGYRLSTNGVFLLQF